MLTAKHGSVKPVLVLGLGNLLLRDDGFGPALIDRLQPYFKDSDEVELVDGGTIGLGLLSVVGGRRAVLILDAFQGGKPAGTIHCYRDFDTALAGAAQGRSAHEGNAGALLAVAALTGDLPERLAVIGIEPSEISTGYELSTAVAQRMEEATGLALELVAELREVAACA
jgi:hydrogenase maturation protease